MQWTDESEPESESDDMFTDDGWPSVLMASVEDTNIGTETGIWRPGSAEII